MTLTLTLLDGTLRWQAPEMMVGGNSRLTQEMDIYAFAICCVEILDKGIMPWQDADDNAVVRFVIGAFCPSTSAPSLTGLF